MGGRRSMPRAFSSTPPGRITRSGRRCSPPKTRSGSGIGKRRGRSWREHRATSRLLAPTVAGSACGTSAGRSLLLIRAVATNGRLAKRRILHGVSSTSRSAPIAAINSRFPRRGSIPAGGVGLTACPGPARLGESSSVRRSWLKYAREPFLPEHDPGIQGLCGTSPGSVLAAHRRFGRRTDVVADGPA
jgi:hypothetical protein